MMRLLVPHRQVFTDEHLVGVIAMANDNGSLLDRLGLTKVRLHYEGNIVDIPEPTHQTFTTEAGVTVTYFGWWAMLKHDGRNGIANAYFEAIPKDPAMQTRIMGPYRFLPQPSKHDIELEVAASATDVAGQRYNTLYKAYNFLRSQGAINPRITVTETARYRLDGGYSYDPAGTCTIKATVPITIGHPGPRGSPDSGRVRTKVYVMRFVGPNITFDMDVYQSFYNELPGDPWQFDGVSFINSNGSGDLYRGLFPSGPNYFVRSGLFTECNFDNIGWSAAYAELARGCSFNHTWADVFYGTRAAVGCKVENHIGGGTYRNYLEALTVEYTGASSSATLEMSGTNIQDGRVLTAKEDGVVVDTFTVGQTEQAYFDNTNYTVANLVDWIDSLPGWTATLIDDTRLAAALEEHGAVGAWGPVEMAAGPVSLYTFFDIHGDLVQGMNRNGVLMDTQAHSCSFQGIYYSDQIGTQDVFVINNALHNVEPVGNLSQLARAHSHVVISHNTLATQDFSIRVSIDYTADDYCVLANNAFKTLGLGGSSAPPVITDNHLQDGAGEPQGATGTTYGGDAASLFVDAAAGDFTPRGALLDPANMKVPTIKYDQDGVQRGSLAAAGAKA